jgi:hypothetical protein
MRQLQNGLYPKGCFISYPQSGAPLTAPLWQARESQSRIQLTDCDKHTSLLLIFTCKGIGPILTGLIDGSCAVFCLTAFYQNQ